MRGFSPGTPASSNMHVFGQSENMHVRLIGVSKIVLRSECERECDCLSLCGPVMDRRPVQGVPRLSPNDRWDRPPRDPTDGLSGYRKWMDENRLLDFKELPQYDSDFFVFNFVSQSQSSENTQ